MGIFHDVHEALQLSEKEETDHLKNRTKTKESVLQVL